MDVRDVLVNVCNEMIDTNKHCRELGRICKDTFAQQSKINTRLHACVIASLVCVAVVDNKRKKMQNEIDILKKEVKELKSAKEE